jgi:hypothetical protein
MSLKRLFVLALFSLPAMLFAQAPAETSKTGTVKIRKVESDKIIAPVDPKKGKTGKKLYFYTFMMNAIQYKVTFPKGYNSDLYPMIFNYKGLAISDADKNLTDDVPQTFSYELFVKNVFVSKQTNMKEFYFSQMLLEIKDNGSFVWVSALSFKDKNGLIHTNEIPTFKIERL